MLLKKNLITNLKKRSTKKNHAAKRTGNFFLPKITFRDNFCSIVQICVPCCETPTDARPGLYLPSRRPLNVVANRFDTGMKTGFILITNRDSDGYGIFQFGEQAGERNPSGFNVRQRIVHCHGVFVCHSSCIASAMPVHPLAPLGHLFLHGFTGFRSTKFQSPSSNKNWRLTFVKKVAR